MKITAVAAFCGLFSAGFLALPGRLMAQAAPGPLPVPPSQSTGPHTTPLPRPKRQEPAPRTTIGGAWKLNHDESDDPSRKLKDAKGNNNPGGYPGNGRGGVGFPFPGSGPMGGPYPGGGYPQGGGGRGQNSEVNAKLQEVVRPASSLKIDLKNAEVDVTDDEYHKLVFFTDGRELQKQKDDTYQEIAAHWDGNKLVSDEKSPEKGKLSRTFELSQDGRQFYETFHVDTNKSKTPVVIEYVYDISSPETEATHETDPNQPVMKRRSDTSNSSQTSNSQSSQPADPNQPVMKRRSDDSTNSDTDNSTQNPSSTQSPQSQTPQPPDPDQPVMKRRTDNSNNPSQ